MGIVDSGKIVDRGFNNEVALGDLFDNFELPVENLDLPEELWFDDDIWKELECGFQIPLDDDFLQQSKINEVPEVKQVQNCVQEYSGSHCHKIEEVHEEKLCVIQPTSPVSELESSGSCSGGKGLPFKSNVCPVGRCRSKLSRSPGVHRWREAAPDFAATAAARRRRIPNSRRYKKSCKNMPQPFVARQSVKDSFDDAENPATMKKCTHCQITKTPQWREGPNGPKTLCNACGVRYRSGRLYPEYRPAASPTFVPSLHSNSHKKVIEMRNKAKPYTPPIEEPPAMPPPQPGFFPVSSYPVFQAMSSLS